MILSWLAIRFKDNGRIPARKQCDCLKTVTGVARILRTDLNLLPMITDARPMGLVVRISRNNPDEPADKLIAEHVRDRTARLPFRRRCQNIISKARTNIRTVHTRPGPRLSRSELHRRNHADVRLSNCCCSARGTCRSLHFGGRTKRGGPPGGRSSARPISCGSAGGYRPLRACRHGSGYLPSD